MIRQAFPLNEWHWHERNTTMPENTNLSSLERTRGDLSSSIGSSGGSSQARDIDRKVISIVTPFFMRKKASSSASRQSEKSFTTSLQTMTSNTCDNCSTNKTLSILKEIASHDPRVKIFVNSRNFGILKNTYNGVPASTGNGPSNRAFTAP
jgi:hypothetical protein